MIVHEVRHVVKLFEVDLFAPFAVVASQVGHVLVVEEGVSEPVEERVVEHRSDAAHIPTDVAHVTVENLTDGVHTSTVGELLPEPLRHFRHGVYTQPVKIVLPDDGADPRQQCRPNIVIFLLEVGQPSKSAVLDAVLVVGGEVVVADNAVVVVVRGIVEQIIGAVVGIGVAHVITDDIHHHPDVAGVTR